MRAEAPTIDHAVINVLYDMDTAVERFRRLGFTLTERGYHSLGSINHLMMFGSDYLELIGVERDATPIRREVADSPQGLNGLVFGTGDAERCHRELAAEGIDAEPPLAFGRPVAVDGSERRAEFRTVRLKPGVARGGRVYFCQHLTRQWVWHPPWQVHANGAQALQSFAIVVPDPAAEAALYERMLGIPAQRISAGESELSFGGFSLRLISEDVHRRRFGSHGCDAGGRDSYMAALTVRTDALSKLRACVAAAGLDGQIENGAASVIVPASLAFNCVLEFVE
ncbi:MAG: VOC family protein [Burkholderiaceae bacterium]